MKSEWRVSSNRIDGVKMYIACRLRDINGVDHSGNREYFGGYKENREVVAATVESLNAKEREEE